MLTLVRMTPVVECFWHVVVVCGGVLVSRRTLDSGGGCFVASPEFHLPFPSLGDNSI